MRFVRSLRDLDVERGERTAAVAFVCAPDADALITRVADEVVDIGPALRPSAGGAIPAYCDHDHVVRHLRAAGCDAVWPGWGFASEDAEFVERLETEGIVFIGPSASAMRALGDKIRSKRIAESVGVPLAPWAPLVGSESEDELLARVQEIGFPLMVKASAGGGGRGIRRVSGPDDLVSAVKAARGEAERAFGDGRVFAEALVDGARHVEVQFVVGADGEAHALGVRDCSIQRRHQKVIEETPSPVLPDAVATSLMDGARRLATASGYRGVGTAEFLYRPSDGMVAFLEVNSRLQVEHTITEETTGDDLVRAQLLIGRGMPWAPSGISRGHAIELRVNAENPGAGFRPSPGRVRVFRPPAGPGVRVDAGIAEGGVIPAEFDSMIAKLIVSAPTRDRAIARAVRALDDFDIVIEGGATNKAFLASLLRSEAFRDGSATTSWLDRNLDSLIAAQAGTEIPAVVGGAIIAYRAATQTAIAAFLEQAQNGIPQNLPSPSGRLINLRVGGRGVGLNVYSLGDNRYEIGTPQGAHRVLFEPTGENTAVLEFDGARKRLLFAESGGGVSVEVDGVLHALELAGGGAVLAPAPAMVVDVLVEVGDRVEQGQRLAMLEAMKMELPVAASGPGIVRRVRCRPSEQVSGGQVLFEIETATSASTEASDGIVLPAPAITPLDLIFSEGLPRPQQLDDAPSEIVERVVSEVLDGLRGVLLGFDVPGETARRIEDAFGAKVEFHDLKRLDAWAPLVDLLEVFADTEELFDRTLIESDDGATEVSAHLAFHEYCRLHHRGEEGAPSLVREHLRRALKYFGVESFEPSPELREALWRLSVAHAHGELRHRLVSSLLRILIGFAEVGAPLQGAGDLPTVLSRVFEATDDRYPFVADNARQAIYVLYKQPMYVARGRAVRDTHEWLAVGEDGSDEAISEYYDELARTAQTVLPHLLRVADPGDVHAPRLLEAALRRLYPEPGALDSTELVDEALVARHAAGTAILAKSVEAATSALSTVVASGERHVDVLCATASRDEALAALPAADACVSRVTFAWPGAEEHVSFVTFESEDGAWVERLEGLDVHPVIAERLQLERLSEFEIERVPTPERMIAFRARARANPRDVRVFVRAEVLGLSPEGDANDDWPRWEFEKVYYEGLRIIRGEQAGRGKRDRFYRNRLTIYVRPTLAFDAQRVGEVARGLEAPTRHLGLESVNVRARVAREGSETREMEFVISKPGRHRLDIRTRAPAGGPIAPLTPYEQRVVRARRMGLVYPYEIIGMLEGRGSEAGETAFHVDTGHFQELDLDASGTRLQPVQRPYGENVANVIVGRITNETDLVPEGMTRILIANDPTRSLGALAEPECRRVIAAIELAEAEGVPVEWIAISSGARIAMDSGTENLDWTARVLRCIVEATQRGLEINVIVCGVNVGAQAYWDAQATMLMHTRGALIMTHDGALLLTGKRALEYSGSVSAEDDQGIGGADRVMGPNGQAQYVARDLGQAYSILFDYYRYTFVPPGERRPRRASTSDLASRSILEASYDAPVGGFSTIGELFSEETNPGRKRPFAMRALMKAVADQDTGQLERWRPFRPAEMVIVWDTTLGGHAVSMIGIESRPLPRFGRSPADGPDRWTGATLFPKSSKKLARALNVASGRRPVVVLANLSGFDGSPESLRKWQLEYGAEIGRAVTNFEGPILFVIVGRYHGGAYVVFSKALNAGLQSLALEGAYASVIGGGPAAAVVFPREVRKRADADEEVAALREQLQRAHPKDQPRLRERLDEIHAGVVLREQGKLAAEFDAIHSVYRAVEVGSLDAVIPAARLREELVARLDAIVSAASDK
jgi:acetyl/propionyl-CoA carboxylase alpha subunit/acetyl-CoA carboxylase carboxyltransferase component